MRNFKSLVLTLVLSLIIGSGAAFAGSFGFLNTDAKAIGGGVDVDGKIIPNGGALGAGAVIGGAKAGAAGMVFKGTVEGEVDATGGGFTSVDDYRFTTGNDLSIGVGTSTNNYATTGASAKIKVDPDKYGFGTVGAEISGFAAQGSLNVSGLGNSPLCDWDSNGMTAGIAGQASIGGFEGEAFALSAGDYKLRTRCGCKTIDSKAGAGIGANIDMWGGSYSESYRFIEYDGNTKTEGMGTNVGAYTDVVATGYDYDWDKGDACSYADVDGGYAVIGGAATKTVQNTNSGAAKASAVGIYVGSGALNSSFSGNATGYSATSVTTMNGAKGTISSSAAGMSVTATSGHGNVQ